MAIEIRDLIPREAVLALFKRLRELKTYTVDGLILFHLFQMAYLAALKQHELLALRITDVTDVKGEIRSNLTIGNKKINLNEEAQDALRDHLAYLKHAGYPTKRNSWLFPKKYPKGKGKRFDNRTLARYLRKSPGITHTIDQVRKAGICHYFLRLRDEKRLREESCLFQTAIFARRTERHTRDILENTIEISSELRRAKKRFRP